MILVLHQREQHGHGAPQQHDPQQRLADADLDQQQIARHFERDIADREDAGGQPEHGVINVQIVQELQLGKADVEAIDDRNRVARQQERDQTPGDPSIEPRMGRILHEGLLEEFCFGC
ncbi:hypothetical protein ACVWY2_009466 [Bradyrhizobium sp. JR6.1]